jgi:FkbH-like protein
MKLADQILLQEVISGHTSVVLSDRSKKQDETFKKQAVLILADDSLEMYIPLINGWLEQSEMFLDIEILSTHRFLKTPEIFLNANAIKIIGPLGDSTTHLIVSTIQNFKTVDDFQKIFIVCSEEGRFESFYDASKIEFVEIIVGNVDFPDVYGSAISNEAISNACHALYACIERAISPKFCKLLFVDLDNTLYSGEVAEGNLGDIQFTTKHIEFAEWLIRLSGQGVFVEILSRNSERVLDDLRLYPTFQKLEKSISNFNFTFGSKGKVISERIAFYKFHPSSVCVIDDNPAELTEILQINKNVRTLRILPSCANIWQIVTHIYANSAEIETHGDSRRLIDLKANLERDTLSKNLTDAELHETLGTRLCITILDADKNAEEISRCVSMSQRTNQFNLSSRRLTESLSYKLIRTGFSFVTCSLTDKFSDSGIVCFLVIKPNSSTFEIFELCISCRALGRNLESLMIYECLRAWQDSARMNTNSFSLEFIENGKNAPVKNWLENLKFADTINLEVLEQEGNLKVFREVVSIEHK